MKSPEKPIPRDAIETLYLASKILLIITLKILISGVCANYEDRPVEGLTLEKSSCLYDIKFNL